MKECILYKKEGKKARCLACAHKCLISDGKTGICGVRKNINGKLILLVYGKVASMNIDPIEKKPIYDFLPKTKTFSFGTVGCNLGCSWCQNYDISQISKQGIILGEKIRAEEIVEQAIATGCKSIAYTYNEPVIFVEFVKDVAVLAHSRGLKNIMVTNGYWSQESFEFISDYIDAVNIDLKGSAEVYKKFCGASVEPVKETIRRCFEKGIHVEVTTLIIPGVNDSLIELEKIAKFLASVSPKIVWHISRFFPMYKMTDKEVTSVEILEAAQRIGKKYLENVYVGNV